MFRRNRITQEHRQRIAQAFENEDEDYLTLLEPSSPLMQKELAESRGDRVEVRLLK